MKLYRLERLLLIMPETCCLNYEKVTSLPGRHSFSLFLHAWQISFIDKYHPIIGTWALESVSYDSAGINITHSSPFDKLVINDNFAYSIYLDQVHRIENGIINIVTQTNNKLELFFDAENPIYSSHIGSHVFGLSNVELISLSDNELIFRTINAEYGIYSDRTITCKK